uniref:Uncharacterized protein n=1 Tax=Daphnia galeata TaxID=27404 RepID=A0A8J2S3D6_9CRUS|nr:unnamed protein product [Daphnia galeata]
MEPYADSLESRQKPVAIAFGSAIKTNLERVDVVGRVILRNILGTKRSNPVEILYAETRKESLSWRTKLLTRNYLINLSNKPQNPMHKPFAQLAATSTQWKPRSTPGLIKELDFVKSWTQAFSHTNFNSLPPISIHHPADQPITKPHGSFPTKNKPWHAGTEQQTSFTPKKAMHRRHPSGHTPTDPNTQTPRPRLVRYLSQH